MPDPDRHIPKYRHYKPKDLAVVRIDGRDHYLGKYDSPESWERYHRLLAEHATRGSVTPIAKQGAKGAPADLTVHELALAYWRHVEAYYVKDGEPTTEVCVIHQVLKVVRELYGHSLARDFGPLSLKACQDTMVRKGWSRKSINRQAIRIRAMWKWAAAHELLPAAVYEALKTVEGLRKGRSTAKERPPVKSIPEEVIGKTLAHLPATPAAMVRLQRLTGMRPQEVVELRPTDIDMSDPSCWVYKPSRHKTEHEEKERVVFIGPKAQDVLRPFLSLDILGCIFSPRRSETERNAQRHAARKTPLYRSHVSFQGRKKTMRPRRTLGDRYTVGTYRQAIHRACDRAFPHPTLSQIPDDVLTDQEREELETWRKSRRWNPHALRHTAATEIRVRYGVEGARVVMGHSDADTTTIYAEQDKELARRFMREIG